jgi:hypothetical protein
MAYARDRHAGANRTTAAHTTHTASHLCSQSGTMQPGCDAAIPQHPHLSPQTGIHDCSHPCTLSRLVFRSRAQLHVEHRDDAELTADLRKAEAAVKSELDYTIALTEKPMYDPTSAVDGAAEHGAAADGAAD